MDECQKCLQDLKEDDEQDVKKIRKDNIGKIFQIIKSSCGTKSEKSMSYADLEKKVISKGFALSDMKKCLQRYQDLDVLMCNEEMSKITLVN